MNAEPADGPRTAAQVAAGLIALLGWDWGDGLDALDNESEEVLLEYIGMLFEPLEGEGPNPFQVDPTPPTSFKESDAGKREWTREEKAWRFDYLARQGIMRANKILWSRS